LALRMLRPALRTADISAARPPPKRADPFYLSTNWRELRPLVLKRDHYRCTICNARAIIADHIVSRRAGGSDEMSNLRSLCRTCDNRLKEDALGIRRGGRPSTGGV
jgi:5-methylcytosine-specific restriction protein A